jgi:anti-sigma B factor antagonist
MPTPRPSKKPTTDPSISGQTTANPAVHSSGWAVITLDGEQDVYVVVATRRLLLDSIRLGDGHVIIDLTAVTFADSSLLGALAFAFKLARRSEGCVRLVSRDEYFIRKLRITGLARLLPTFPTLAEALGAVP